MWLWDVELQALGFRRKNDRYWQCARRWGLSGSDHISVWSWSEQAIPATQQHRYLVELTEFHVTFEIRHDNVHFYYHEHFDNQWHPGGHTSGPEIARLGRNAGTLRADADAIARQLVAALRGSWRGRHW